MPRKLYFVNSGWNKKFVLGMEYIYSSNTWRRIDADSNVVTGITNTTLNSSYLYSKIVDTTIDGCAMVQIPKFYFLYKQTSTGHKWWISHLRFNIGDDLAKAHPAFVYNGNVVRRFFFSKYETCTDPNDSNKLSSQYDKDYAHTLSITDMKTKCEARNVNGITGFTIVNIYHISALQMLFLFDYANPNSQTLIGDGQAKSVTKTGKGNATWRGIYELWGYGVHVVAGIRNTNGVLSLWPDAGNETFITPGISVIDSSSGGWVRDICPAAAEYGIFLPNTTTTSQSQSIFNDKFWSKNNSNVMACTHGGSRTSGTGAGLFNIGLDNTESALITNRYTTRLIKI